MDASQIVMVKERQLEGNGLMIGKKEKRREKDLESVLGCVKRL